MIFLKPKRLRRSGSVFKLFKKPDDQTDLLHEQLADQAHSAPKESPSVYLHIMKRQDQDMLGFDFPCEVASTRSRSTTAYSPRTQQSTPRQLHALSPRSLGLSPEALDLLIPEVLDESEVFEVSNLLDALEAPHALAAANPPHAPESSSAEVLVIEHPAEALTLLSPPVLSPSLVSPATPLPSTEVLYPTEIESPPQTPSNFNSTARLSPFKNILPESMDCISFDGDEPSHSTTYYDDDEMDECKDIYTSGTILDVNIQRFERMSAMKVLVADPSSAYQHSRSAPRDLCPIPQEAITEPQSPESLSDSTQLQFSTEPAHAMPSLLNEIQSLKQIHSYLLAKHEQEIKTLKSLLEAERRLNKDLIRRDRMVLRRPTNTYRTQFLPLQISAKDTVLLSPFQYERQRPRLNIALPASDTPSAVSSSASSSVMSTPHANLGTNRFNSSCSSYSISSR